MDEDWQSRHLLRALAKGDREANTNKEIEKLALIELRLMMSVIRLVGETDRVRNFTKVNVDQHDEAEGIPKIHEAKAGKERQFFFYHPGPPSTAIFLGDCNYDKGSGGIKSQRNAFATARSRRDEYLAMISERK